MIKVAIIVPCYNEEEILENSFDQINDLFSALIDSETINEKSRICFVDDGSTDNTWPIIKKLQKAYSQVTGIKLSRNFGHQNAMMAGLDSHFDKFDAYITFDADLQDDISMIPEMLKRYSSGDSVVYGARSDRSKDSFIKRKAALSFYSFMRLLGTNSVYNHAEFRLIDNRVLKEFLNYDETNLYIRGIFPAIGFKQSVVYYDRKPRLAGETKYPFHKQMGFAWEAITSLSIKPLRLITILGAITFLVSIILGVWAFVEFILGNTLLGWFSTIIPITFFGGIQMLSLGIIGEYIGKIYLEVKRRPRFIIDEEI